MEINKINTDIKENEDRITKLRMQKRIKERIAVKEMLGRKMMNAISSSPHLLDYKKGSKDEKKVKKKSKKSSHSKHH